MITIAEKKPCPSMFYDDFLLTTGQSCRELASYDSESSGPDEPLQQSRRSTSDSESDPVTSDTCDVS